MRNTTRTSDKTWGRETGDSLIIGAGATADGVSLVANIPSGIMKIGTPVNDLWLVHLVLINEYE